MRKIVIAGVAVGAALLAGCGSAADARSASGIDVSILRVVEYDYPIFDSLEHLAADQPMVAAGVVEGFDDGRTVLTWNPDLGYHDTRDRSTVMKVRVDEVFKGEGYVFDGHVYVTLPRGGEMITKAGEPARPAKAPSTVVATGAFDNAIPKGTRIALTAVPASTDAHPAETWVGVHDGYPEGATLMATPPQGIILEDGGTDSALGGTVELHTELSGWQGIQNFQDVERRLEQQFPGRR